MKALSQSDYGLIRSLYQDVYAPDIAESILDEFTDEDLDDLTEEYIEEQVTEFFEECLEEGLDIDIVEQTICESVDTELEILTEVTNPAQVAAMRMRDKTSAASGEGQKAGKDAGAAARAKLKVSKQKVGSASPEKKASKLSQIKGVVKKVGQAAKGGVGLATRAVGTAVRAGSAVKSAAKKGYERGRQGSGGGSSSSSSSDSGSSSSSDSGSSSSSSSTSGTGPSSSSSSTGGGSSAAPKKRKDGLLKRGLKKVVRGITKGVSAAAGAVKAGADSLTDRARKEDMNHNKELATIKELYSQVCNHQSEEELEQIDEADSLAAMQARREKRLAAQRKREGTNDDGKDFGHDYVAKRREANMKKEELEATGLFTVKEIEAIVESENVDEAITSEKGKAKMKSMIDARTTDSGRAKSGKGQNVKDIKHIGRANVDGYGGTPPNLKVAKNPVKSNFTGLNSGTGNKAKRRADALTKNEEFVDEAMSSYDRNRKRAAQRAADRNAARAAGKTGVVPGVGYVTARKEKETYTDEKGTVRHKSGAKNEEFEQLDELSKGTMGSYVKKASKDVEKRSYSQGSTDAEDAEIGYPGQTPKDKKIDKRQKGIGRAVGKLTRKEELESLRQAYLSIISEGEQPNIEHLNRYGGHPEVKPKKKKKTPFEKENPGHSEDKPTARFTKADREEMLAAKKEASDKVKASAKKYGKK